MDTEDITLSLPTDLLRRAERLAAERNTTVSGLLEQALRPRLQAPLEDELKMVQIGLESTRARLNQFENTYGLSSTEFEQRLKDNESTDSVEFSEWRAELDLLALLEQEYRTLTAALSE